jgi:hypothetical protein
VVEAHATKALNLRVETVAQVVVLALVTMQMEDSGLRAAGVGMHKERQVETIQLVGVGAFHRGEKVYQEGGMVVMVAMEPAFLQGSLLHLAMVGSLLAGVVVVMAGVAVVVTVVEEVAAIWVGRDATVQEAVVVGQQTMGDVERSRVVRE